MIKATSSVQNVSRRLHTLRAVVANTLITGSSFLLYPNASAAIMPKDSAYSIVQATTISVSLIQIFFTVSLFLLIPTTLVSILVRIVYHKKSTSETPVIWNLKQVAIQFVKFLVYYVSVFGVWLIVLHDLSSKSDKFTLLPKTSMLEASLILLQKHYVLFLLYIEFFAILGPFIVYWWNLLRKKPATKPTLEVMIVLTLILGFIFLAAGLLLHWVFLLGSFKN